MMIKPIPILAFLVTFAPIAAHAQVIEIDEGGEARTFDQPTVFAASGASPIRLRATDSGLTTAAMLAQAARNHNLDPALLAAVAWQESRGSMRAISVKGARGVMQLMPATAAELGVIPDDLSDNIRGGALYLRRQLDRFGSVPLALAAYNAGPGAVLRYGGIPPYLETRNYVARIMAHWRPTAPLQIASNPSIEVPQP